MKYYTLILTCVFLPLFLLCQTVLTKQQIDSIDTIIKREISNQGIPGLTIAISIDSSIVLEKAYGYADIENKIPTNVSTKFRSASVGKPMTASAVMQLVEIKKVNLGDNIQKHYPTFPLKKWPVTVYHLLTHQSGIREYQGGESVNNKHYKSIQHAFRIFEKDSLLFEPGTAYAYSSFNYNLLGAVIEKASRRSYAAYMKKHVFEAANMTNTVIEKVNVTYKNCAKGYKYSDHEKKLISALPHNPSDRIPAGGFLTTAHDIVCFAMALYTGKLVKESSFSRMISNPKLSNGKYGYYGLGWGCFDPDDTFYGFTEVFHGGQTPGVSNMLTLFLSEKRKIGIALMTNLEGMQKRGELCESIGKIILEK